MKRKIIDRRDRISEMPAFIVHHILSYLDSQAELVRMSSLSKKWFALTASFPILDFNMFKFRSSLFPPGIHGRTTSEDDEHAVEKFNEYVDYTISRFCEKDVSVHTFKLVTVLQKPTDVDMVDKWIESVVEKSVQALVFDINVRAVWPYFYARRRDMYSLPNKVLSASSLTSLTMCGCALPLSLITDGVKFKSLKLLSLDRVPIDEEEIKCLTSGCPRLEEFNIQYCIGFKRLCLVGLRNLLKLGIDHMPGIERIDIEAPNLKYLSLRGFGGSEMPCIIVASCKMLTTLSVCGNSSSISKWFAKLFKSFPIIENLFLNIPTQSNNLKVSSNSLRKLVLHPMYDLEGLEIDAPRLVSFEYSGFSRQDLLPLASTSAHLKACMECSPCGGVDTFWFQRLRRFLDETNRFKVLKLQISAIFIDLKVLKAFQFQPFELEHLELQLVDKLRPLVKYKALIDALFWCFCPQSLTLRPNLAYGGNITVWRGVVKLAYEKLLQQVDDDETNIQIVMSSASIAKKHFNNFNSLMKAFTLRRQQEGCIITFIKEQVVEEGGQRCVEIA